MIKFYVQCTFLYNDFGKLLKSVKINVGVFFFDVFPKKPPLWRSQGPWLRVLKPMLWVTNLSPLCINVVFLMNILLLNFWRNRYFFTDYIFWIPVSDCRCNFLWTTRRIEYFLHKICEPKNGWKPYEILGIKRKLISELSLNWHNRQHF